MLVEVARKAYLASIVPVIVNAILNEHQVVVDIVAFVNKGDFPRSRLNEKQRGKILAGWVSRKLRTIAQFAIKDTDREALRPAGPDQSAGADEPHRASMGSIPSHPNNSLRGVSSPPPILEQPQQYYDRGYDDGGMGPPPLTSRTPPGGNVPVEMPADERVDVEQTPTAKNYPPQQQQPQQGRIESSLPHGFDLPNFDQFGREEEAAKPTIPTTGPSPPPGLAARPGSGAGGPMASQTPPQIRLPGVDGRESLDDWNLGGRPGSGAGGNGGDGEGVDDWTRDAFMSMNLAGTLGGK